MGNGSLNRFNVETRREDHARVFEHFRGAMSYTFTAKRFGISRQAVTHIIKKELKRRGMELSDLE